MDNVSQVIERARAVLERIGLLLFSDAALPSLVGLIVGEPLHRSWLSHPLGHMIYGAMSRLEDDPAILSTKLIAGKVTFVHRKLWPALYALATAREAWQLDGLSPGAAWLLAEVNAQGELRTDLVVAPPHLPRFRAPDAARELERRLLVHATEMHTPSGAHAKVLETWPRWAQHQNLATPELTAAEARAHLEAAAERLAADVPDGVANVPWRLPTSARVRR